MACHDPNVIVLNHTYNLPDGSVSRSVAVPCGKCYVCRKNKVDEWSFRLRQEQKHANASHFVTLTYAPEHVPRTANNFKTLHYHDLRKYWMRLRKWMKHDGVALGDLRYYAVGEYGENFGRPHYHAIVLNATIDHIIEAWCVIDRGTTREQARGRPIGHVHIGTVTTDSIAYCVKYLDKGRKVPAHARDDRVKEFARMSRNLGASYMTPEMIAWHRADPSRNYIQDGLHKIALPKYYRDRIFTPQQREIQRGLSIEQKKKNEAKLMAEYFKAYPHHTEADFYEDLEYKKLAQFKLLQNGKKRKI